MAPSLDALSSCLLRFYSVIAPGDTIYVIGEFDDQGKCNVNCDENFLIIHPDILMSGTRVAATLIGTLLHQIFQAGLMREIPTKEFLEEYARIVLHKNVPSLYACAVHETDMHKTLIEAIPRILNWILLFRDSEVVDIEEMAWAPKYGLKGMIDASV
ncbi:hypothetical protein F0562_007487 [Nyssa sinensis]|uniref:DNA replication factor Dna2 N-terminal domain-containing protein n=1 Tax=Nyssa sinensis TaxID=561372 RepID=A0A5J5A873_9ASTE|nr:hypothetical protein F0562_007487 [Nyssa sinensis]